MRQQSQIIGDIKTLAEGELNARLSPAYENIIHDVIHGNEHKFDINTDIPWKLLKFLVGHPEIKRHIHPSGIRLSNAHITPDNIDKETTVHFYDFVLCESTVPLLFTDCLFDAELRFAYSKLKALGFVNSTIHAVELYGAEVEGALIFDGCFFNRLGNLSVKAHEIKVGGTLRLRQCVAVGGIRLLGARIGGDFDASGAFVVSTPYGEYFWNGGKTIEPDCVGCLRTFYGLFDTPKLSVNSWEWIRDIIPLATTHSRTLQSYDVSVSQFKALDLYNAVIAGNVKLRHKFRAFGEVSLNSARIEGAVLMRGAFFFQPDGVALSMDGMKVRMSLYLQQDDYENEKQQKPFVALGTVSMRGARIAHRFVCSDAFFQMPKSADVVLENPMREREAYALFAKRLRTGGDVILNKSLSEGGNTGWIASFVSLENARIGGRLFFHGKPNVAAARPFLNLAFAVIRGSVELSIMPESESCNVSLRSAATGSIDIAKCLLDKVRWDLEGLQYEAVESYNVDDWIAKVLTTAIQPYDAFISFLRKRGDERGLWMVGIAKENKITDMTRPALNTKFFKSLPMLAPYLWRVILRGAVRYGYEPFRALGYLGALIICGWLIFSIASGETIIFNMLGSRDVHLMFPTKAVYYEGSGHKVGALYEGCLEEDKPCRAPENYPEFSPLVYSIELATPIPDLGQEEHWNVEGDGGWFGIGVILYKWFHVCLGWSLSLLFVLSPTKLLRRD